LTEKRRLGKTEWDASVIGFGARAIGADWGETDDDTSRAALRAAAAASGRRRDYNILRQRLAQGSSLPPALPVSGGTVTLSVSPVRPRWFRA
jgi:hypothetical protein